MGPERCVNLLMIYKKIVSYFLLIEGFSVGISDMLADDDINEKMKEIIDDRKTQIDDIMKELHLDIFENLTGQSNKEHFESKVNSILNDTLKKYREDWII